MENTVENNRLIAEFMGLKPVNVFGGWSVSKDHVSVNSATEEEAMQSFCKSTKYDSDWNWLMEVIKEIADKTGFQLTLGEDYSYWNNQGENPFTIDYGGYNNINSVYEAVVDLIKWHNSNK